MTRRPLSPRSAIVGSTVVLVVVLVAILVSYFGDSAAYRDGREPERHGVVVSAATHRHMTCGRSEDGFQVQVSYQVDGQVRTEPLPTCDPSALTRGSFVVVWERRPDLLTTVAPGHESRVLLWAVAALVAVWALAVGLAVGRSRRSTITVTVKS
jgi:hypothetical protein